MKKVITYGTFDLLHNGHINLLKRAKQLGDYLIVGVTTDNYDKYRGKLNVQNDLMKRIEDVRSTGLADKIIIEEYFGQKIEDVQKYKVDVFAIGDDWRGQFDYLNEFCEVKYLERTKGVSSTQLRNERSKIINLGIIGSKETAENFMSESKYVSGIEVVGILNPEEITCTYDIEVFSKNMDAVYIGKLEQPIAEYIRLMLTNGKHVLFEEPIGISPMDLEELLNLAKMNSLVLLEAISTAYCPAFNNLITQIKSRKIGAVKDIALSSTQLSSYSLMPIIKLLGDKYNNLNFYFTSNDKKELFIQGVMQYNNAFATLKVGRGAKFESSLIISGTDGYAYVPEPWWKMESFEIRFDDKNQTEMYFYKLVGDGSRYVIQEFVKLIQSNSAVSNRLSPRESIAICSVIEKFYQEEGLKHA